MDTAADRHQAASSVGLYPTMGLFQRVPGDNVVDDYYYARHEDAQEKFVIRFYTQISILDGRQITKQTGCM